MFCSSTSSSPSAPNDREAEKREIEIQEVWEKKYWDATLEGQLWKFIHWHKKATTISDEDLGILVRRFFDGRNGFTDVVDDHYENGGFLRPFPKERQGQDPNTILTPMVKEIAAEKDWVDVKYTFQCSGEPWINANYWDKFWIWKMERALSLEPREGFVKLDGYIMKLPS